MTHDSPHVRVAGGPSHARLALTSELSAAIARWSTSQRAVVDLAANFAESDEWAVIGARSPAHWIAGQADIEVCTAREWIRVGRALKRLPSIADAFERDQISYSKVRALTRLATAGNEHDLLAIAATVPAGRLGQALAAWIARTSDDRSLERHQHEQRSLTWRNEPDGMVTFSMRLPPLMAGTLIAHLATAVMRTRVDTGRCDDWPSIAQRHADAFGALIDNGGSGLTTEVVLHVRSDGCTLDDGTPIPRSVIERIASRSMIRALIHDAEHRPINASTRQRHPTARQKRLVKERDRRCVDCGTTQLLQFDHVPDFDLSGRTVVDELELRCAPCHRRRHAAA